jgi:DNA (cytosine-5)-methyltransferase 1
MNYYNEFDPHAARWLRNLISDGLIPAGRVDERSIKEVMPNDLAGFTQCHFFAGIGGWPLALQFAVWPSERLVWTGSCPCQPFSCAGKKKTTSDERHLWPELKRLIRECKPAIAFGEQVASKDGRLWLSGVRDDLEALAYEVGAADLCAAGVTAPHIRQRLYWMAVAKSHGHNRMPATEKSAGRDGLERSGATNPGWMGDSIQPGLQRHAGYGDNGNKSGRFDTNSQRPASKADRNDCWGEYETVPLVDGTIRRASIEPWSFPLAYGIPRNLGPIKSRLLGLGINTKDAKANRAVRIKGYGNAIVPQLAAEFIIASREALNC